MENTFNGTTSGTDRWSCGCTVIPFAVARTRHRRPSRTFRNNATSQSGSAMPDMESIAREPSHEVRRQKLAQAVELLTGRKPDDRQLDHQMLMMGLAAGHGCSGSSFELGHAFDDPAVPIGLALHHVKHHPDGILPVPPFIRKQLERHVADGDPAARLVQGWIAARSAQLHRTALRNTEGAPS